jgi:hypothetical protein
MNTLFTRRCVVALAGFMCAPQLHANLFEVTVNTAPLALSDATLVFDLVSGDAGPSTLSISDFSSMDATLGEASFVFDLGVPSPAPTLSGNVTLDETGAFLSEYQQHLTLGTSFTFRFSTTGTAPGDPLTPDSVSFFLLDADALQSLVTTGASGDTQAIFRYDIGSEGPPVNFEIIGPDGVSARIVEVTMVVPEPATALLVLGGVLAIAAMRVSRTGRRARTANVTVARRR